MCFSSARIALFNLISYLSEKQGLKSIKTTTNPPMKLSIFPIDKIITNQQRLNQIISGRVTNLRIIYILTEMPSSKSMKHQNHINTCDSNQGARNSEERNHSNAMPGK